MLEYYYWLKAQFLLISLNNFLINNCSQGLNTEAGDSKVLEQSSWSAESMHSSISWTATSRQPAASERQRSSSLVLTVGNISASNDTASDSCTMIFHWMNIHIIAAMVIPCIQRQHCSSLNNSVLTELTIFFCSNEMYWVPHNLTMAWHQTAAQRQIHNHCLDVYSYCSQLTCVPQNCIYPPASKADGRFR